MALQKEIWLNYIIGNLFLNNDFLMRSVDESQYVVAGKIIHIPNAGIPSKVVRNRETIPATISKRGDTDVVYVLDEFTTDPKFIPSAEKVQLSYDKVNSVLSEDMAYLREAIANWMLYNWRPADAKIIRTTGAAVPAHLTSATGNRKKILLSDITALKAQFDNDLIPDAGRNLIISSQLMQQLIDQVSITANRDYSFVYDPKSGIISNLEGFTFHKRGSVIKATNAGTPAFKEPDIANAATDNDVVLAWSETAVSRAIGATEAFQDLNNPVMYGDVYSFLQRMGGRRRRADNKGVYALVQDAA